MPARNVSLTSYHSDFVDEVVASGRFQNASEVVREALRLLQQRQREDELKLQALREAIAVGKADAEAGRIFSLGPDEIDDYLSGLGRD